MIDAFDLWRAMFWIPTSPTSATDKPPAGAEDAPDLSSLPVLGRIRIELPTMWLLERSEPAKVGGTPLLIVAPYSLHDGLIADFAPGHSLAAVLVKAGVNVIAMTYWKSATPEMRDYDVDTYLSDLNVAVDDLGGRATLVGLCQGGWLAAIYAGRFPSKVAKLVLVGAPIDLRAAELGITRTLASTPPATIEQMIAMSGGRVLGSVSLAMWAPGVAEEYDVKVALQHDADAELNAKFAAWNARTLNLPGRYFLQTTEWLFRENRLARDGFPALGRISRLSDIRSPIFVLAAEQDAIVAVPQATAVARLCTTPVEVRIVPGRHLSLFMGRHTLRTAWPEIGAWLVDGDEARKSGRIASLPGGRRRRRRQPDSRPIDF